MISFDFKLKLILSNASNLRPFKSITTYGNILYISILMKSCS